MDLNEMVVNGNNQAWVRWKADVEILLEYVSPATDREMRTRITKKQWVGHQRMTDEIDEIALRDWFCTKVIKAMRGVTKEGEPYEPTQEDFKRLWDGSHEFGLFIINASRELDNFVAEKNV